MLTIVNKVNRINYTANDIHYARCMDTTSYEDRNGASYESVPSCSLSCSNQTSRLPTGGYVFKAVIPT